MSCDWRESPRCSSVRRGSSSRHSSSSYNSYERRLRKDDAPYENEYQDSRYGTRTVPYTCTVYSVAFESIEREAAYAVSCNHVPYSYEFEFDYFERSVPWQGLAQRGRVANKLAGQAVGNLAPSAAGWALAGDRSSSESARGCPGARAGRCQPVCQPVVMSQSSIKSCVESLTLVLLVGKNKNSRLLELTLHYIQHEYRTVV